MHFAAKGILLSSITVFLISIGVLSTKKVPNKYLLNGLLNEWNWCHAQCFSLFSKVCITSQYQKMWFLALP